MKKRLNWCKWYKSRDWSNKIWWMSKHFIWNHPEKNGLKRENNLNIQVVASKKLTVGSISSNGKCIVRVYKEDMAKLLYKKILKDYLPEFKRTRKGDIMILMDNHPVHKKTWIAYCFIKNILIKIIDLLHIRLI